MRTLPEARENNADGPAEEEQTLFSGRMPMEKIKVRRGSRGPCVTAGTVLKVGETCGMQTRTLTREGSRACNPASLLQHLYAILQGTPMAGVPFWHVYSQGKEE